MVGGNRYDRRELAGAFGDLGTLVPFVVGYITIARLDPQGVLLGFGLLALATGFYFRTPMSVQPMKAIATVALTHPQKVTPGAIFASAVVTGVFWLGMGVSGAVSWLAALTSRPVVRGIILGLGLSFILEGVSFMNQGPVMAVPAVALTFFLLGQPRVPAMLVLLVYGAAAALSVDPALVHDLANLAPSFRLPSLHVPPVSWAEVVTGALVLAIPQTALTLGNAVIATVEEHNALFPHRSISVRLLALDHGLMNLVAAPLGGVPMCPGGRGDGGAREIRRAHRRGSGDPWSASGGRCIVLRRLRRDGVPALSGARARRDSFLRWHRAGGRPQRRHLLSQRAHRAGRHRGHRAMEHGGGVPGRAAASPCITARYPPPLSRAQATNPSEPRAES